MTGAIVKRAGNLYPVTSCAGKKILLMSCRDVCGHDWLSLGLLIALFTRCAGFVGQSQSFRELNRKQNYSTQKRSVFSCFLLNKTFVFILLAVFAPVNFFSWFFLMRFYSFHKLTFCLVAYSFVLKKLVFHFFR